MTSRLAQLARVAFARCSDSNSGGQRIRSITGLALVFLLLFSVVVVFQWASGAYAAEFGAYPDESAHYVTGLMVRDYVAALAPVPPMQFAEDYYLHYPKVAIGYWPPLFYVVQAAWTLVFSPSRWSVVVLMGLLTTLLASTVYLVMRREFSAQAGVTGALLLISLPLVQLHSAVIMADTLAALLIFWATLCFGRYLESEKWQDAAWFGVFAALAILTKASGLMLALVPPVAMLLSRRLRLFSRASLWIAPGIVLALCGPWYLLIDHSTRQFMRQTTGLGLTVGHFENQFPQLWRLTGAALLLLIVIGFLLRVVKPLVARQGVAPSWAAAAALVVSAIVFRSYVGAAYEARHLIALVPVLLMFLAAGVEWLGLNLPLARVAVRRRLLLVAAVAGILFVLETFTIPKKNTHGFAEVAQDLLARNEFANSVFLVSSQGDGEGMFIAEVAMRERRPGHYILRGYKVLARSSWSGAYYRVLYGTPVEVVSYLESIPVGVLVMDLSAGRFPAGHHRLLKEMLRTYPERWELIGSYPRRSAGGATGRIEVYRMVGHETKPVGKIRIDMRSRLGKIVER